LRGFLYAALTNRQSVKYPHAVLGARAPAAVLAKKGSKQSGSRLNQKQEK
jgi:hypothetical protein